MQTINHRIASYPKQRLCACMRACALCWLPLRVSSLCNASAKELAPWSVIRFADKFNEVNPVCKARGILFSRNAQRLAVDNDHVVMLTWLGILSFDTKTQTELPLKLVSSCAVMLCEKTRSN